MKKIAILSSMLLFCASFLSNAQDVIYKKDGSREDAKIIMIAEKEIQYKKFNNMEGPVYTLAKSQILMITYENGEYEMLVSKDVEAKMAKQELSENFAKNLLGYHLFDVIYGDFTFSYERILSSGTIGIVIPFGFGYAYNTDYFTNSENWVKNLFYSGLGINFYPTGQGKWRYFVGPNVRVGFGKQSYWTSMYDENMHYIGEEEIDNEGIYTKFIVDNGVRFTPVRNLGISAVVGVGIRFFPGASENYSDFLPTAHFSFNLDYRF